MKNEQSFEELLQAAGFDFDVVLSCPDPQCVICVGEDILRAA